MNYLIDTHVFLWSLFNAKKLSPNIHDVILDFENNIYVSLISFWEISIKYNLGKIKLKNILPEDLPLKAEESGFGILELTPEEVSTSYKLPKLEHKDPFDRLIVWQCIQNHMTLISSDDAFKEYKKSGLKLF